jgi:4-alpha-glucanotransferase
LTDIHLALKSLWEKIGIEPNYTDNRGKTSFTDWTTALRILKVKGVEVNPEIVSLDTELFVFSQINLPSHVSVFFDKNLCTDSIAHEQVRAVLRDKSGSDPEAFFSNESGDLAIRMDEKNGLTVVEFPLPKEMNIGIHEYELTVEIGKERRNCNLSIILCPDRAFVHPALQNGKRIAGISIALYGVRSERNWGVGDFTDLKRIIDWACDDLSAHFVGLNPLHAIFNNRPYNSSPYLPSSRIFRNFIYLDVTSIPEYSDCNEAQQMVSSRETQEMIRRLRKEDQVNYEEAAQLKEKVLRILFERFYNLYLSDKPAVSIGAEVFFEYCKSHGSHLENFAVFCALRDHFRLLDPSIVSWRQWPEAYRSPGSPETARFLSEENKEVAFWMYTQWQMDEQLRDAQNYALGKGMLIGLYHDLALAVDTDGADYWSDPKYFHTGFSVGAPPDAFAPDGQDWGFPPPNSTYVRQKSYEPVRKRLDANCKHGGALRIDHVMQAHHLYWIPSGEKPADGVYVKDNEEELLNLLALQSQSARVMIIGEDLGTLPSGFRERLMEKGILSYRLFYFERLYDGTLVHSYDYPREALVSISTHDLPTLAGFWSGADLELRKSLELDKYERYEELREERSRQKSKIIERLVSDGYLPAQSAHQAWISPVPTDALHTAVLRYLFETPAWLAVISQEDIFLDDRQQNLPGTTFERPNWVTKMRFTVEELKTSDDARRMSQKFRQLVQLSGRVAGE